MRIWVTRLEWWGGDISSWGWGQHEIGVEKGTKSFSDCIGSHAAGHPLGLAAVLFLP